jgi:YVTN family beta-propeller protein
VTATIATGRPGNAVAVDPGTHTAYVVNSGANTVTAIDTSTNTVEATIPVGGSPFGVAVDPGLHRAYVSNTGTNDFNNSPPTSTDDTVSVIDTTTNTVTDTITVFASPRGVAVDPVTHKVDVAIYLSGQMAAVIDPTTSPASVTTSDILGSRPWAAAVDPSTHLAYVTTLFGNTVSVLDGTSIVSTICCFGGPTQIAVDPDAGQAYVTNSGAVSVIDTSTNTVTGTLPTGSGPSGTAVDPSTHTAYVTNYNDNTVSVIDTSDDALIATVPVGDGPAAAAVDPSTHQVYVVNSDNTVSVINAFASQDITFTDLPVDARVGGSHTATATGGASGEPVTFSTTSAACTVTADGQIAFAHVGTCVIAADQAGNDQYTPATQQTTTYSVGVAAQTVAITSTAPSAPVVGTTYPVTATGGASGEPVTLSIASATTNDACTLSGSTVRFVHPGACVVNGDQAGNSDYAQATTGSQTIAVSPAASTTTLTVTATRITAHVAVTAPGSGTATGTVAFSVAGQSVGTAPVTNGVATLAYAVSSGATRQVAAVYSGSVDVTGSSVSTSRSDPSITATLSSAHLKSKHGWYRAPVTVTFHCLTHGAALTTACPAAVVFRGNGAGLSVTRTIAAVDGGTATVVVRGINLDQVVPNVSVGGVRNGGIYNGTAPTAKCLGRDTLSGIVTCTVSRKTSGSTSTVTAVATDGAGNVRTAHVSYTTLPIYVQGATLTSGAFPVKAGHTYTIVVVGSALRPTYIDAAVYPRTPSGTDHAFHAAGYHRWTLGVTMTPSLRSHTYWNIGVKIGASTQVLKIRVS